MIPLNDPIQAYLDGPSKDVEDDGDEELSTSVESNLEDHHTLLWRQDPDHSFSDWKIVLSIGEHAPTTGGGSKELTTNESGNKRRKTEGANERKWGSSYSNHASKNTFHVHRNILASVSVYFRSQFSAHTNTIEQKNATSAIVLHQQAIGAFPVFLDYLYNPNHARKSLSFYCYAVALRHLAMYFGVDTLLKDITDIILQSLNMKVLREIFSEKAYIFHDDTLLEAVKKWNIREKCFLDIAEAVFDTLTENPAKYLQDENSVLLAWKQIMCNTDVCYDPFSAARCEESPNVLVCGAGLKQANGVYKSDGSNFYSNGVFFIIKNFTWILSLGYYDRSKDDEFIGVNFYYSRTDSDVPPSDGWFVVSTCTDMENLSPAPTSMIPLNSL